jgi:hypothetical protein
MRPALKPLLKFEFCPKFDILESVRAAPAKPLDANPLQLLLGNRAAKKNRGSQTARAEAGINLAYFLWPFQLLIFPSIESFGLGIATDLSG